MTRAVRLLAPLLAVLATAAVPLCAAEAAAGAAASSKAAGQPGFSIAAVGFDSYFRYRLAGGRSARGTVRLVSSSRQVLHVVLQAADVGTAATGGLEYGASDSSAAGSWLKLARHGVRLAPGATVDVAFTTTAPPTARPGDHFVGIVALNRAQVRAARRNSRREGFSLRFLPRLAIALQVTVPGKATRELKVDNAAIDVTPSSTDITLLLLNTGNKLIKRTRGRLAISQNGSVLVRRGVTIDVFVPTTKLLYRIPLVGRPAEGSYRVKGVLRPEGGAPVRVDETVSFGSKASGEFKRETGREATKSGPSALLIGAFIGALVVVLLLAAALIRTRKRL